MVHLTVRPGRLTTQRHFELPKRDRTLTAGARRIADYAHMMQLRKSRWTGTQIIQIGA